jgi:hypothetical protein
MIVIVKKEWITYWSDCILFKLPFIIKESEQFSEFYNFTMQSLFSKHLRWHLEPAFSEKGRPVTAKTNSWDKENQCKPKKLFQEKKTQDRNHAFDLSFPLNLLCVIYCRTCCGSWLYCCSVTRHVWVWFKSIIWYNYSRFGATVASDYGFNQTHTCLVTDQQYNQLLFDIQILLFRLFCSKGWMNCNCSRVLVQSQRGWEDLSECWFVEEFKRFRGIIVYSLVQQNLIRLVDEVYGRVSCVVISLNVSTYCALIIGIALSVMHIKQISRGSVM